MLFPKETWDGLADGSLTVAFRCWRRPTVKAGGTLQSPGGLLSIDAVDPIGAVEVTDADARCAGHADRDTLLADLADLAARPGREDGTLYRIRFHRLGDDPRHALAADADLTDDEVEDLRRRLDRLDAASRHGPWTEAFLRLIAANPGLVARELAPRVGRERDDFKLDVRKLKNLGLTTSLAVGYELSPRGRALLESGRHR